MLVRILRFMACSGNLNYILLLLFLKKNEKKTILLLVSFLALRHAATILLCFQKEKKTLKEKVKKIRLKRQNEFRTFSHNKF